MLFSPDTEDWMSASTIRGDITTLDFEYHHRSIVRARSPSASSVFIINTTDRTGILPDPRRPLYAGAKAFIITVTGSMASQAAEKCTKLGRAPICINSITPGPIDTPLERAIYPNNFEQTASVGVPMARVGTPDEIASTVLFLADNAMSSYITGTNISVDGGYTGSPIIS